MAILLIASAILASGPPAQPQSLNPRTAAALNRCETALARRGYPDVQSPTIALAGRSGHNYTYRGRFSMMLRPAPGGPGEVTPHHIQLASYGFTCVLRGSHVRRLTIRQQ